MENINVFAMLYKHRANSKGEAPLAICVTLHNKPVAYRPLKKKIAIDAWDEKNKKIKTGTPNATPINTLITKEKNNWKQIF